MSDNYEETADWLTDTDDTIRRVIEDDDGPDKPIEVKEITQSELEAIEDKAANGPDEEVEAVRRAISEYLVEPDVPVEDIPMGKRNTLYLHMQLAWSGIDEIEMAMDNLDIDGLQGNR